MVEETYNEAMRLYEYYERMNDEIAKQEHEEAAKAREAEGLPVVLDAELAEDPEVRAFLSPLLLLLLLLFALGATPKAWRRL